MTVRNAFNLLSYQVGWFLAVWSAAQGRPWLGASACALLVGLQLIRHPRWRRELALVVSAAAVGWAVDSAQAAAGVFRFHGGGSAAWLCPPWLVGIWALFGTTLNGSMAWLHGRPWLGAAFGAIGGPLAYWAGARLGAVTAHPDLLWYLTELAVVWAATVPALAHWARYLSSSSPGAPDRLAPMATLPRERS